MDIQKTKAQIVPIAKKYNITKAALFGSIVSGKMTSESDIDLLDIISKLAEELSRNPGKVLK